MLFKLSYAYTFATSAGVGWLPCPGGSSPEDKAAEGQLEGLIEDLQKAFLCLLVCAVVCNLMCNFKT